MAKRLKLKIEIIKEEYYTISSKELAKELGIKLQENQYLECKNMLDSDDILIYVRDNVYIDEEYTSQ